MKKIITLLAIIGVFSLQGCTTEENVVYDDNDTIPEAFEIQNVDLARVADNEYSISNTFQNELGGSLYDDETVLVYRLTDLINSTTPVWQLIPRTIYFSNGDELDYDYDFSKIDFIITARGNYNLLNRLSYIDNQTFRIVIIPSNLLAGIDVNNYQEVMNTLKLKETQVQKIKL